MQTLTLSDKTLSRLRQAAESRGRDADDYAEELLVNSLANSNEGSLAESAKPFRAMEFSAVAPSGRTSAEIDEEIEASRAEWDANLERKVEGKVAP